MPEQVWYRVDDVQYAAPLDESDNPCGSGRIDVIVQRFPVIKETPCGAWLDLGWGSRRFAMRDARKRFAVPTEAEAFESFRARKQKQRRILVAKIERIDIALAMAEGQPAPLPF